VHITLQRSNRGKTKSVTVIKGMAATGLNLKDVAKQFSKKFACSSSATGPDEIIVQGDVADELLDYIPEQWPQVRLCSSLFTHTIFLQIEEDNIEDLGDVKR
jgi:density-regulated protein DRP1